MKQRKTVDPVTYEQWLETMVPVIRREIHESRKRLTFLNYVIETSEPRHPADKVLHDLTSSMDEWLKGLLARKSVKKGRKS